MTKKITCKLHEKIERGEPLTEEDYKELGSIVKDVLSFMAKEKIVPSPQNYERWFLIFCYAKENNMKLSKAELLDLYLDIFQIKGNHEQLKSAQFLEGLLESIYDEVKKMLKSAANHNEAIGKGGERLEQMVALAPTSDIKKILRAVLEEVKTLRSANDKFITKLEEQRAEIEKLREELRKVREEASIDPLTGLRNRRSFERALQEFFRDYKKYGYPFSVIMIDLDNFKQINDTYGHLAGDKVLREVGNILRNYLRAKDVAARTGGEEFTIILPGIRKDEAVMVAERLRKVMANHTVDYEGKKINFTASFGVAEMRDGVESPEDLLKEADEKLYKAKRTGKDKVVA